MLWYGTVSCAMLRYAMYAVQVPELIQRLELPPLEALNQRPATQQFDPAAIAEEVLAVATDQSRQRELAEEAKNALRSTPKGVGSVSRVSKEVIRTRLGCVAQHAERSARCC